MTGPPFAIADGTCPAPSAACGPPDPSAPTSWCTRPEVTRIPAIRTRDTANRNQWARGGTARAARRLPAISVYRPSVAVSGRAGRGGFADQAGRLVPAGRRRGRERGGRRGGRGGGGAGGCGRG